MGDRWLLLEVGEDLVLEISHDPGPSADVPEIDSASSPTAAEPTSPTIEEITGREALSDLLEGP